MSRPFIPERPPTGELVEALMEVLHTAEEESEKAQIRLDTLTVGLPVEMEMEVDLGRVTRLQTSPPLQRTSTTVRPVLHGLILKGKVEYAE